MNTALIPLNQEFRVEFYWALNIASEDSAYKSIYDYYIGIYLSHITIKLGKEEVESLIKGYRFSTLCHDKEELKKITNSILPIMPKFMVKRFVTEKIEIKDSSTAPIMIPCICTLRDQTSNTLNMELTLKLLYKFEDIRKDRIVMDIIRLSNIILNREGSPQVQKCKLLSYNVLPTAIESGMI